VTPEEKLERQRLALEAKRLTTDETLISALSRVRQNAVDALIRADATITADIIRFQTKVTVCDEFLTELATMIELQSVEESRSRMV
jgi:plasmid maintenance system antidote protein VapI